MASFDPDSDGFQFGLSEATRLHNNLNILQCVRRQLGIVNQNKGKVFDQSVEKL